MNLLLKREPSSPYSTIGTLYLDDKLFCFTLEDVVRDVKIPGETAIPAGSYEVDVCPKCGCINSKLVFYDEGELFVENVCGWCNAQIEGENDPIST